MQRRQSLTRKLKQQKSKRLILLLQHIAAVSMCSKMISTFLIFAALVLRVNDCRLYTPFKRLRFSIYIGCFDSFICTLSQLAVTEILRYSAFQNGGHVECSVFSQPSIYIDGWLYGMRMTSVVCNVPVLSQNDSTYHHSVFTT